MRCFPNARARPFLIDNLPVAMECAMALNVVAVTLSVLSVLTTTVIALRQTSMMRHANELPIFIELTNEFRSPGFQEAHDLVVRRSWSSQDLATGVAGLSEDERLAFTR